MRSIVSLIGGCALSSVWLVGFAAGASAQVPRAVEVARATEIPRCMVFVDAASKAGRGTLDQPFASIGDAVRAASAGANICVAEGTYAEQLAPGDKAMTLAGGFQSGQKFSVRDSARYVSKARGRGGSFVRIESPAPSGNALTAIDGFDISGYSQAIYRDIDHSQRFDITNNHIHDNVCVDDTRVGAGFALSNVSGRIANNVIRRNFCGRGGAGFLNNIGKSDAVVIENNLIDANAGREAGSSHGGGLYIFATTVRVVGNLFTDNTVTGWGGGLYVGANTPGGQHTNATLVWNVYRGNKAGAAGGGMFCDDGANCISYHEIYDRNCGGNIYLDSGPLEGEPTRARFDHLTNHRALAVDCTAPGPGVRIDAEVGRADRYSFINAIFWDNAPGQDFAASCDRDCGKIRIDVSHALVQQKHVSNGLKVVFGSGILTPTDPRFVAPASGDFHLKSTFGRWTAKGRVLDDVSSPGLGRGYSEGPLADNPERAGPRLELGAFGNSLEASFAR